MRGGGEHRNSAKKLTITARKVDKTPSPSHTVGFEITATPQVEILFTASPHQKNIKTATPQIPMSPSVLWLRQTTFFLGLSNDSLVQSDETEKP